MSAIEHDLAAFSAAVGQGLTLSDAELKLVEAIFFGDKANLGSGENAEDVRADVLRRLCIHAGRVWGGQPGRFRIEGGRILGRNLQLTGLRLDFGLQFRDTELPRLVLQDTRLLALELLGGRADRIDADRVDVAHDVVLGGGFACDPGGAWFRSAFIGGDFNCGGGHFLAKQGPSLMLDGTRIGGRLYLRKEKSVDFHATGGVFGRSTQITGAVLCNKGRFDREFDFTRAQVHGDFGLKGAKIGLASHQPDQISDANLLLGGMRIAGELSLNETTFEGPKLVLARTQVEKTLRWDLRRTEHANTGPLKVDLMQARAGYLHDNPDSWHNAKVRLDGFSFDGIAIRGDGWLKKRKEWLSRQWDDLSNAWSPHPYDQVRSALLRSGHESAARAIAVERERVRLKKESLGKTTKLVRTLYGGLLGYGYKPFRFFVISLAIILVCALAYHTIRTCQLPTKAPYCGGFKSPDGGSPHYDPFLFSLDSFVPVDLGQVGSWQPREAFFAYLVAIETAIGWLFTALLLGAVTGILRRD